MLGKYSVACLLGFALADDHYEEKEGAMLAKATSGDFVSEGMIMEWMGHGEWIGETETKAEDESSDEEVYQAFIMGWKNYNDKAAFENGAWIQNWAQWEDPEATGKYYQMTCNVKFDSSKDAVPQENVVVRETYGTTIDAASITGVLGAPSSIGTAVEDKKIGW